MSTFGRPGVSDDFLCRAGCAHVGEEECIPLYGFRAAGIAIPFRTINGDAIVDGGKPFARVRLYTETESQKYHQRSGSETHIYIPHNFRQLPRGSNLFVTEGEFKAASLSEAGLCAVGLCGISGAMRNSDREPKLHDELGEILEVHKPACIVFLGDSDAVLNCDFSREAAKLHKTLFGSKRFQFVQELRLAVCPLNGPKGVDDVRGAIGERFNAWFASLVESALVVPPKASPVEIFSALLRRETERVKHAITGDNHDAHQNRVKLLQSAGRLAHETGAMLLLKPLLAEVLNVKPSELAGLVRDAGANHRDKWQGERRKKKGKGSERKTAGGTDTAAALTPARWFNQKFPALAAEHGEAVLEETDEDGVVFVRDIGEDFLAATLSDKGSPDAPTVFVPVEEKFYSYLPTDGIYVPRPEPTLIAKLSRLIFDCVQACKANCDTRALEFRFRDAANLTGAIRKARGLFGVPHDFFATNLTEFLPCANGMLRLSDKTLLSFRPSYRRRNKLAVPFDPSASCPLFLDTLMRPALDAEDLDLLQRACGLFLIGENIAQKIVLLPGTPGGGKGTFVRVLVGIIGASNLASLRPQLLGERFELGRFLGRTLLYGADVPADFLNQRGASVLKSLTGYDPVTLEFKNSNETPSIICRFNVIVTCNSRLTVRLEGDVEAWRRRLAIVDYHKPKPEGVIADLDQRILATEAPGVLNWMLEGLDKLRDDDWQLRLTKDQQAAVDNLLLESDGHGVFAREYLRRDATQSLTVPDCFTAYVEFCNQRGWTALTKNRFGALIGDVVIRQFGVTQSHNIPDRDGKPQRGWRGIGLREKIGQPTDKTVSHVSQSQFGDGWDTSSPVQPQKNLVETVI